LTASHVDYILTTTVVTNEEAIVAVDLLQRIGLSKYEAEAYLALLVDGPLTGYELGKRSAVPLSKSYETLERLARRGLAVVQPGDPPKYAAERADRLVSRTRAEQSALMNALDEALSDLQRADPAAEFWVVRGRAQVLARAEALLDEARSQVVVGRSGTDGLLGAALDRARTRGCRITTRSLDGADQRAASPELLALLVDDREALVGTLTPSDHAQAVTSANPALLAALRGLAALAQANQPREAVPLPADGPRQLDWLAWEDRKHRRLWPAASGGGRVA
jgi:hypothetical protein